jgi:hypothetical protein
MSSPGWSTNASGLRSRATHSASSSNCVGKVSLQTTKLSSCRCWHGVRTTSRSIRLTFLLQDCGTHFRPTSSWRIRRPWMMPWCGHTRSACPSLMTHRSSLHQPVPFRHACLEGLNPCCCLHHHRHRHQGVGAAGAVGCTTPQEADRDGDGRQEGEGQRL